MRRILQATLAIGTILSSALPLHAQSNSGLRPSTDHSVTTGIGTGSSFKNVPPPPDQPPPDSSRKLIWDTPEAHEAFREDKAAKEDQAPGNVAEPPPPAAEVKENPRTMITRDRIESPQH